MNERAERIVEDFIGHVFYLQATAGDDHFTYEPELVCRYNRQDKAFHFDTLAVVEPEMTRLASLYDTCFDQLQTIVEQNMSSWLRAATAKSDRTLRGHLFSQLWGHPTNAQFSWSSFVLTILYAAELKYFIYDRYDWPSVRKVESITNGWLKVFVQPLMGELSFCNDLLEQTSGLHLDFNWLRVYDYSPFLNAKPSTTESESESESESCESNDMSVGLRAIHISTDE